MKVECLLFASFLRFGSFPTGFTPKQESVGTRRQVARTIRHGVSLRVGVLSVQCCWSLEYQCTIWYGTVHHKSNLCAQNDAIVSSTVHVHFFVWPFSAHLVRKNHLKFWNFGPVASMVPCTIPYLTSHPNGPVATLCGLPCAGRHLLDIFIFVTHVISQFFYQVEKQNAFPQPFPCPTSIS